MTEDGAIPQSVKRAMRQLIDLRREYDGAEKVAKDLKKRRNDQAAYVNELLGKDSVTADLGGGYGRLQFTPTSQRYSRIINEGKLIGYFQGIGQAEGVVEPKIRKAALNDKLKEALDHGLELPPGVDYYEKKGTTVTRRPVKT